MSTLEINKIVGAIIFALLTLQVIDIVGSGLVAPRVGGPAAVKVPEGGPKPAAPAPPQKAEPITGLLASANPEEGAKIARKCQACHSLKQGGPNKVGPDLWGVVNRPVASHPGFSYSSAMKAHGGNWTYGALNAFLWKPRTTVPGTKMGFAGLKKPEDRADVIAYLRTLSSSPAPLP